MEQTSDWTSPVTTNLACSTCGGVESCAPCLLAQYLRSKSGRVLFPAGTQSRQICRRRLRQAAMTSPFSPSTARRAAITTTSSFRRPCCVLLPSRSGLIAVGVVRAPSSRPAPGPGHGADAWPEPWHRVQSGGEVLARGDDAGAAGRPGGDPADPRGPQPAKICWKSWTMTRSRYAVRFGGERNRHLWARADEGEAPCRH